MFTKIIKIIVVFSVMTFVFSGCATILKGYEGGVDLLNAPDSIRVFTKEGVEIPVSNRKAREYSEKNKKYEDIEIKTIKLRTNKTHILLLKIKDKEKLYEVYPKLKGEWLVLDIITGLIPAFIDAYTGNWNSFPPILVKY